MGGRGARREILEAGGLGHALKQDLTYPPPVPSTSPIIMTSTLQGRRSRRLHHNLMFRPRTIIILLHTSPLRHSQPRHRASTRLPYFLLPWTPNFSSLITQLKSSRLFSFGLMIKALAFLRSCCFPFICNVCFFLFLST